MTTKEMTIQPFRIPGTSSPDAPNSADRRALVMPTPAHRWPSTETLWLRFAATAAVLERQGARAADGTSAAESYYRDAAILAGECGVTQITYDAAVCAVRNAAALNAKP
jgi:hypothetical protein